MALIRWLVLFLLGVVVLLHLLIKWLLLKLYTLHVKLNKDVN